MHDSPGERPDPEKLLRQVELQERMGQRGKLKVFLGYASGVGKSYQMLDEARRRRERGEDVVLGLLQPKYSAEVERLVASAEVIAPLRISGEQVLDVEAILQRRPRVVVIDGLAFNNPPGSRNPNRWMDVEELLQKGISVITSMNLQYIEEFRDELGRITGKRAAHSIPRAFLDVSDEIVVVDAPTPESVARSARVSRPDLEDEEQKLSRLREMALVVAADVVDRQLEAYLEAHGIEQSWGANERVLLCVTPKSNASTMIASGRRNADRFHGELYVTYVRQPMLSAGDQATLEGNLSCARTVGAEVVMLEGLDVVDAILKYARRKAITQIYVGHTLRQGGWRRLWGSIINRLIRQAEGIDVTVFPH